MQTDCKCCKCGDVGFVGYEKGLVTDLIGDLTQGKGEAKTLAQHQFQVVSGGMIIEADASLSHRSVVHRSLRSRINQCVDDKAHFVVLRPPMTIKGMIALDNHAKKLVGKRYGYCEIMLQGIDGWLKKRGWLKEGSALFSKLGSLVPGTVICSGASNQCLVKAGVLDEKFVYLSPDDTLDEATRLGWMVVCIDNKGEDYWRLSLPKKGGSNNGNCCKSTYC